MKKRDPLKHLIRHVEPEQSSSDFTASVMKEITAREEVVVNEGLRSLLSRAGAETAPADFGGMVMAKVHELHVKKTPEPIISTRAWWTAAAIFVISTLVLLLPDQPTASGGVAPYLERFGGALTQLFGQSGSIPLLYVAIFVALAALLALEYLIRFGIRKTEKG